MTTEPTVPTNTHTVREFFESTIDPSVRCSCGWEATTYRAEQYLAEMVRMARNG